MIQSTHAFMRVGVYLIVSIISRDSLLSVCVRTCLVRERVDVELILPISINVSQCVRARAYVSQCE